MTRIYGLTETRLDHPRFGEIRYVGKADNPVSRLDKHMRDRRACHRVNWLQALKRLDLLPSIVILAEVSEDEWQAAERQWITYFKDQGADLVNETEGGDGLKGFVHSIQSRIKMSLAKKGKPKTKEHAAAISRSLIGNNRFKGHTHTGVNRAIMADAISNSRLGKPLSEETKARISLSKKGKPAWNRGRKQPRKSPSELS